MRPPADRGRVSRLVCTAAFTGLLLTALPLLGRPPSPAGWPIAPVGCAEDACDARPARPVQPPETGDVVEVAEVGGLHHHYERRVA